MKRMSLRRAKGGRSLKEKLRELFRRNKEDSLVMDKNDELLKENDNSPVSSAEGQILDDSMIQEPIDKDDSDSIFNEDVIQLLFEGAPQLSIDENDNPTAAFPWDRNLMVRDAVDHVHLDHPAFSLSTARKHLIPGLSDNRGLSEYSIGTVEIPNMISAQGKEPGSVGFDYFLEEAIADTIYLGDQEDGTPNSIFDRSDNMELLQSNPERIGIRQFDLQTIGERLMELSSIYQEYKSTKGKIHLLKKQKAGELYSMLFTQILTPPNYDSSAEDPTGIKLQILVLVRILKLKSIWFDFSSVEWRIRIGQILWTDIIKPESTGEEQVEEMGFSERNILILQIILACELLLRLDSVSAISTHEVETEIQLTKDDILEFRKRETDKTRWDLLLARTFLRNIEVRMAKKKTSTPSQSWSKSIFGMGSSTPVPEAREIVEIAFVPRDLEQQLSGLFHWAKVMSWPDRDLVEEKLRTKLIAHAHEMENLPLPSVYSTPIQTPKSVISGLSSYFDARSHINRFKSTRSFQLLPTATPPSSDTPQSESQVTVMDSTFIGGWLTRAYITGLVLPGEAISHFLISSLLENDTFAISKLGDSACLYGGIVYQNRGWWSKSCIVGRVMAAVKGSKECMGWIYVPGAPKDALDGWYDIASNTLPVLENPRIKQREEFGLAGSFFAEKSMEQVTPQDFVVPTDSTDAPSSTMWFDGLYMKPVPMDENASETPQIVSPGLPEQNASLRFSTGGESGPELHIPLLNLIQFISAYPCFPSGSSLKLFKRDGSNPPNAHPLHISQTFHIIKANELFSDVSPQRAINLDINSDDEVEDDSKAVTVIDARYDATLELLARAWCSWKGENAIIGRVKVTCLACCVREARILDVKIIIRVE